MAQKSQITIAIMTPGDMGNAVGRALLSSHQHKYRVITNLTGRSERTQKLSNSAGITDVKTDEEIVQQADFIFSILLPSEATSLAQRFAPLLKENQHIIFVDMNAIAPQAARSMASLFPHNNFVDGCITGLPPGSKEYKTKIYLSGEHAQKVADLFQHMDLINIRVVGNQIGQASALKMCASLGKGVSALAIQAFVTAKYFELEEVFSDDLKETMPQLLELSKKIIPHMPPKAARWAAEMEETAKVYEEIGLSSKMFEGAAETYRFVAEETPLGKEIIEERKLGKTFEDALEIMVESLHKNKQT